MTQSLKNKEYSELKPGCGMLWEFNGGKNHNLEDKIKEGYDYFLEKYGVAPTHCEINPIWEEIKDTNGMLVAIDSKVGKINAIFYVKK